MARQVAAERVKIIQGLEHLLTAFFPGENTVDLINGVMTKLLVHLRAVVLDLRCVSTYVVVVSNSIRPTSKTFGGLCFYIESFL